MPLPKKIQEDFCLGPWGRNPGKNRVWSINSWGCSADRCLQIGCPGPLRSVDGWSTYWAVQWGQDKNPIWKNQQLRLWLYSLLVLKRISYLTSRGLPLQDDIFFLQKITSLFSRRYPPFSLEDILLILKKITTFFCRRRLSHSREDQILVFQRTPSSHPMEDHILLLLRITLFFFRGTLLHFLGDHHTVLERRTYTSYSRKSSICLLEKRKTWYMCAQSGCAVVPCNGCVTL